MSYVAAGVTVGTAIAKGVGAIVAKRKAKKEKRKAERQIKREKAAQAAELQKGIVAKQQAQKDLSNEYAGQATISPETQYARNVSERGTASAIDKAMRSGSSTGEIMNMVSGLTARGQVQGQSISAQESTRRGRAMAASKGAALDAAETGLAGKQMQIGLQDQAYNMVQEKQNQINNAAAQNYQYFSDIVNDLGSAATVAGNKFGK